MGRKLLLRLSTQGKLLIPRLDQAASLLYFSETRVYRLRYPAKVRRFQPTLARGTSKKLMYILSGETRKGATASDTAEVIKPFES
jgi:hypothetical protein